MSNLPKKKTRLKTLLGQSKPRKDEDSLFEDPTIQQLKSQDKNSLNSTTYDSFYRKFSMQRNWNIKITDKAGALSSQKRKNESSFIGFEGEASREEGINESRKQSMRNFFQSRNQSVARNTQILK